MDQRTVKLDSTDHGEFVIYQTEDGLTEVHLRVVDKSVWMTQSEVADLFDISPASVSIHLKNIYAENELSRDRTIKEIQIVRSEGDRDVSRTLKHYNLDAIVAVGYRVKGPRGNQFRRWASEILQEYLRKGFVLNDEKLKDPRGTDYFDELLARIRDIRSSEARLYLKLRDIVALATDYNKDSPKTRGIFSWIQDKLHYAVTGQTASEIIATRCDPGADNLGLSTFKGKVVRKGDVATAKNYLTNSELTTLNLLVSQFLEYADLQTRMRSPIYMKDWLENTDSFIEFNGFEPLKDRGRISREEANRLAKERYELFNAGRESDNLAEADAKLVETMKQIDRRILADRARLTPRVTDIPDEES
ncbi:hydroxyacid dehydrogenase [Corynebacterium sp. HMSC075D04]|uniref:RhuM family protein n=1 Tax=Corynebacterium sp. HMSC075D04 TaxID=1739540 RepID=UPI0008A141F2|nr:RhuM family protein [Corynebacterium sp. HMSC075D04]OFO36962.1 hydroxyacid dehydrogenase [Corynebacterium sp. HMSC075D04]